MSSKASVKDVFERMGASLSEGSRERRRSLTNKRFTIISNDCWGAEVYKDLGLPYETPLIGTFVMGPCYMRLVTDAPRILTSKLEFVAHSRYAEINERRATQWYPIGRLSDDVEIQFLHYRSQEDAQAKWARRLVRSHFDRLFFKLSADKDRFVDADLVQFDALPINKVAFSERSHPNLTSVITTPNYTPDGKAMYAISLERFDIVAWLNT